MRAVVYHVIAFHDRHGVVVDSTADTARMADVSKRYKATHPDARVIITSEEAEVMAEVETRPTPALVPE